MSVNGGSILASYSDAFRMPSPTFRVLGVRVNAIQIPEAISTMERWIRERNCGHFVAVTGMHGVMEAQRSRTFKAMLEQASLVVPDGMPLVWLGRLRGHAMRRRVYGPELMETFCRTTGDNYSHFFYGGADGVAQRLAETLSQRYNIRVAGTYTPPFRALTPEEEHEMMQKVEVASPDILWVGLSTPKQERWMWNFSGRLNVPVMVGVGAAFDFATGRAKQAPRWMQESGLEWLFRLITEPKRLWRRYIVYGAKFVWNVSLEILKLKKYN